MKDVQVEDLQLVEIVWVDSHSPNTSGWVDLEDIEGLGSRLEVRSAGYVIDQETNEHAVTVASHVSQVFNGHPGSLFGVMTIPRVAIVSMREIKPARKNRRRSGE